MCWTNFAPVLKCLGVASCKSFGHFAQHTETLETEAGAETEGGE